MFCQHSLSFLSCHDLIEVALDCYLNRTPPRVISVCNLSNFNPETLHSFLYALDWATFHLSDKLKNVATGFLHEALDSLAPLCTFCARRLPVPWIDRNICLLMRVRDSARKAFRRRPSSANLDTFCALRNQVNARLDAVRNGYFRLRLDSAALPAWLWPKLRSLELAKLHSSTLPSNFSLNQLNSFFTSSTVPQPLSLLSSYSPSPPSASTLLLFPFSSAPVSNSSSFYFAHITPRTLLTKLTRCLCNPDYLIRRFILDCFPVIFYPVLDLLNLSLNSSFFPFS